MVSIVQDGCPDSKRNGGFETNGEWPLSAPDDIEEQVAEAIPDRCSDCGVQCELGAQLTRMLIIKHMMTHAAESLIGQSGESFNATIDANAPAEIADQIKQLTREATAGNLDEIDRQIEVAKEEITANSSSCSAPLKMRTSKAGVSYTVSVCTSPKQYMDDGSAHMPTHITKHSTT